MTTGSKYAPAVCLVMTVVFSSLSAALGKHAALQLESFDAVSVATNPYYVASLICVGLQAIVWPHALRHYSLSYAYMTTSVVYINLLLIAYFVFGERITANNALGTTLIAIGNVALAQGRRA
jgi:uncharacterized membrane protein